MSGTVTFENYPVTQRTHGVFAEITTAGNSNPQQNNRILALGQATAAAALAGAPLNQAVVSTGPIGDATVFGTGSMLAAMVARIRSDNPFTELWVAAAPEPSGAAANATFTVTGPASVAGTVNMYVNDVKLQIGVGSGDTATTIASNIATAIAANPTLPVTCSANAAAFTVTAKNIGTVGNDIQVGFNLLGGSQESFPSGVNIVGAFLAGGTGTPTLTTLLANLPSKTFDYIISPWNDGGTLNALQSFLSDSSGRWSWSQQLWGHVFYASRATLGLAIAVGMARNNQHESFLPILNTPTWTPIAAASFGAVCAQSLQADPGVPLQDLALSLAYPTPSSPFSISQRNTLLYSGCSTYTVNDAGQAYLDRVITTYQTAPSGQQDTSYLDAETMFSIVYLVEDMKAYLANLFSRRVLVSDNTPIPAGSNRVTGRLVLDAAIGRYRYQVAQGNAQNADAFAAKAVYDTSTQGAVKLLLPFNVVDQLRQIPILVQLNKS